MGENAGIVLRIERASVFDGQGLRTVVFLKGCPLACAWCSTPEGQRPEIEQAKETTYGMLMTLEEVIAEVSKDEVFFFHSGGGVTLSGGEPLMQADFAAAILRASRLRGINTALESSVSAPFAELEKVMPLLDTMYVDIKLMDEAMHRKYCGAGNRRILDNIGRLTAVRPSLRVIARVPLVPGVNDSDDNLAETALFCSNHGIGTIELLPYHRLGVPTYAKLGRAYSLPEVRPPSAEYLSGRRSFVGRAAPGLTVL